MIDLQRLVIAKPSGNTTAIIFDDTPLTQRRAVGAAVQNEYPSVEQVLFVEQNAAGVRGAMAGGEFCGNAARALGYVLAGGQESVQRFAMSGVSEPVTVAVAPGRAQLSVRATMRQEKRNWRGVSVPLVHIQDTTAQHQDGICHAVLLPEHPSHTAVQLTAARLDGTLYVKQILSELGLLEYKACGMIIVLGAAENLAIAPYVYVRDVDTLYAETACASGSIAVAQVLRRDVSLLQPSGEHLTVTMRPDGAATLATVAGAMAVLWDGTAIGLEVPEDTADEAGVHLA